MGWKSNQVQRLSVGLLTLFIASLDASQNSVNQSIKKHQSTFENVAMDIWDLAEVGYQEYKSAEQDTQKRDRPLPPDGVRRISPKIQFFLFGGPILCSLKA